MKRLVTQETSNRQHGGVPRSSKGRDFALGVRTCSTFIWINNQFIGTVICLNKYVLTDSQCSLEDAILLDN